VVPEAEAVVDERAVVVEHLGAGPADLAMKRGFSFKNLVIHAEVVEVISVRD
jgi:hypothetical protein